MGLWVQTQAFFGVGGFGEQLLRQTGHAQAISELIGVRGVSKGQSTDMIHIRVSRIDLLELAPNLAGLLRATQMAQRDARKARDKSVVGVIAIRSLNTAAAVS